MLFEFALIVILFGESRHGFFGIHAARGFAAEAWGKSAADYSAGSSAEGLPYRMGACCEGVAAISATPV